jgi:hypothetical protein
MPTTTRAATEHEIESHFLARATTDSGYAVAYALLRFADAQHRIATQIKFRGSGDAASPPVGETPMDAA